VGDGFQAVRKILWGARRNANRLNWGSVRLDRRRTLLRVRLQNPALVFHERL
jgi:hypothetical protein